MDAAEDIAAPGDPALVADGEVAHAASDSPATASDSGSSTAALGRTLGWSSGDTDAMASSSREAWLGGRTSEGVVVMAV
jgi:hypothetical protein